MLPSKGYFNSLNCPFFDSGACKRPHCHFRHTKKETLPNQPVISIDNSRGVSSNLEAQQGGNFKELISEVLSRSPYYEPGESSNPSSIDSSTKLYNEVSTTKKTTPAIYEPPKNLPSYKPTPISELKKRHIPVVYSPSLEKSGISHDKPKRRKIEYVPKSENGLDPAIDYKPTPFGHKPSENREYKLGAVPPLKQAYTPSKISSGFPTLESADKFFNNLATSISDRYTSNAVGDDFDIEGMDISPEIDMLSKILRDEGIEEKFDRSEDNSDESQPEGELPSATSVDEMLPTLATTSTESTRSETRHKKPASKTESVKKDVNFENKPSSNERKQSSTDKSEEKSSKTNSRSHSSGKSHPKRDSHSKTDRNVSKEKCQGDYEKHSSKYRKKSDDKEQSTITRHKRSHSTKSSDKGKMNKSSSDRTGSKDKMHSHASHSETKPVAEKKVQTSNNADDKNISANRKHGSSRDKYKSDQGNGSKSKRSSDSSSKSSSASSRGPKSSKKKSSKNRKHTEVAGSVSSGGRYKGDDDSDKSSDVEEVPISMPESIVISDSSDDSSNEENVSVLPPPENESYSSNEEEVVEKTDPPVAKPRSYPPPPFKEESYVPDVRVKQRITRCIVQNGMSLPPAFPKKRPVPDSQILLERWQKMKSTESEKLPCAEPSSSHQGAGSKVRIAHVPNVSLMLTEKQSLLSRRNELSLPSTSHESDERTQELQNKKPELKCCVGGQSEASKNCPPIIPAIVENSKVPTIKRQVYLKKVFELYTQIYNIEVAKIKAIQAEKELCSNCKTGVTYVNKVAQLCLTLKREIAVFTGEIGFIPDPVEDVNMPSYTYGRTLYKCFEKYLLEDLKEFGIPVRHETKPEMAVMKNFYSISSFNAPVNTCINCKKTFEVNEHGLSIDEGCRFHPGKKFKKRDKFETVMKWRCCNGEEGDGGCSTNRYHVRDMVDYDNMDGFVQTEEPATIDEESSNIYSIDCEMCFTTMGCELTRCTVMDIDCKIVYDQLCQPSAEIIDYCTRFSGITEEKLSTVTTRLEKVQEDLLKIFNARTILIGHGIANDLKAIKILHSRIVDTSDVFRHKGGSHLKRKLCDVTKEFLHREIQNSVTGHDSSEDAGACMQLMLYKIKEDCKAFKPRTVISIDSKK